VDTIQLRRTALGLALLALSGTVAADASTGAAAGAATGAVTGAAVAQATSDGRTPAATLQGTPTALTDTDARFLHRAIELGAAEVQAAQLALQKSNDDAVRSYAEHMIDDHGPSNQRLITLATSLGAVPPSDTSAQHRRALDDLNKQTGADFDREYMRMQVQAHQQALALFEAQARDGSHPELKAIVEEKVPTLREHLRMAQASLPENTNPGATGAVGGSTPR
jgi:putative membrane protein